MTLLHKDLERRRGDPRCPPTVRAAFEFGVVDGRLVVTAFDGGAVTSDASALLLGTTDSDRFYRAVCRLFQRSALAEPDRARDRHARRPRVVGLALDMRTRSTTIELRHDPAMAILAGELEARRPGCTPLAGKTTLNRLEHGRRDEPTRYDRIGHDAAAIERLFIELSSTPPQAGRADRSRPRFHRRSAARHQEGRFFHGYYDCWCYLPL